MSFKPTAEQQDIIAAVKTGKNVVIEAGAGAGKTSTLKLAAEALAPKTGTYVAYNKAIQMDAAASFPSNVQCKTAHSLAYGWMMRQTNGKAIMNKLRTNSRVPSRVVVGLLNLPAFEYGNLSLAPWTVASMVQQTVVRFCSSADIEPDEQHVPFVKGAEEEMPQLRTFLAPFARKAWQDIISPSGKLRFVHDHYLKMWALSQPKLRGDFIFLDEAQDANPVIAQVVQGQTHMQQIMVGDRSQAIYGWRGAIDAMTNFRAEHRLVLSKSFRFGQAVADEANKWLALLDAPLRIEGAGPESIVGPLAMDDVDAILCRTNAGVLSYAMEAQEQGKRVAIVGGAAEIKRFAEAAADLMTGRTTAHPDLVAFKTWADVQSYVEEDDGADLKVMVRLVDEYGPQALIAVAEASVDEDTADIIVSTAHKAKGREWDNVLIATDFKAPEEGEEPRRDEMMLAYVAVTRAQKKLDRSGLAWVDAL